MTSIYFPSTLLATGTAEALAAALGPLTLCAPFSRPGGAPLADLAARGLVRWCAPDQEDDAAVRESVAECLAWGRQHRGGEAAFLKALQGRVPFAMEETPREIAGEIRGGGAAPRDRGRERLRRARVFLALAETLDLQERETAETLEVLAHREQAMFQALTGGGDIPPPTPTAGPPPAATFMPAERLQAWGVLAGALFTDLRAAAISLVTVDGQAFDLARERLGLGAAPSRRLPWAPPAGKAWSVAEIAAEWERLASTPEPVGEPGGPRLEVVPLTMALHGEALECLAGIKPTGPEGVGRVPAGGAGFLVRAHGIAP